MSLASLLHDRVDHLIDAWFHFVQRHAIPILLVSVLAAVYCAHYTVENVRINTDTSDMLSKKLPWRHTQIDYNKAFPQYSDNIVVVVDAATADEARDGAEKLAQALRIRADLFDSVYLPQASEFFRRNGLLYLDEDALQELADNLARVQPFLARLGADQSLRGLAGLLTEALTEPEAEDIDIDFAFRRISATLKAQREGRHAWMSWEELISGKDAAPEDKRVVILTRPRLDFNSLLPGEAAMEAIRTTAATLELTPAHGVSVRLTGGAALSHDELKSVSLGAQLASVGSLVMVALVMIFGLRSGWLVITTLAALVLGLIFTACFATLAIGELNLISVAFAVMYIGLGADFAIYLCLRYKELAAGMTDHREALTRAARHVGGSLGICTLTTAIGFFAFIPTSYRGVAELGIIAGAGMFISLFVTLTILPALLSLRRPSQRMLPGLRMPGFVHRLLAAPLHHTRTVIICTVLLAIGAVLVMPRAQFDHNPLNLQDQKVESVVAYKDLLAHNGTSPWSIVALAGNAREAAQLKEKLEPLASVDSVATVEKFVPSDQETKLAIIGDLALTLGMEAGADTAASTPAPGVAETIRSLRELETALASGTDDGGDNTDTSAAELLAELRTLLQQLDTATEAERARSLDNTQHALLVSLPGRLATLTASLNAGPVRLASLPEEVRGRWITADGRYRLEVQPKENLNDAQAMRRFVNEVRSVLPAVTGSPVIYLEASNAVVKAFTQAFLYALLAITVILWLAMDKKVDVALVLAPLLLAALLTGAATVLLGIPFNFANIIALPLLLGMGVDNGIHMVHRFRTAPPEDGMMLKTSTATAIGLSALTNTSAFGNLAVSPHAGTASMGVLLTVGILLTLACTMFILPSLMALLYHRPMDGTASE